MIFLTVDCVDFTENSDQQKIAEDAKREACAGGIGHKGDLTGGNEGEKS
jgi:hypothetical protein